MSHALKTPYTPAVRDLPIHAHGGKVPRPPPPPRHLEQDEEHVLLLVCGGRRDEHGALGREVCPPWQDRTQLSRALGSVQHKVLGADQHAARAVAGAGHGNQHVGAVVHWFTIPSHHMVQTQVQLVQGEVFLHLGRGLARRILHSARESLSGRERKRQGGWAAHDKVQAVTATA